MDANQSGNAGDHSGLQQLFDDPLLDSTEGDQLSAEQALQDGDGSCDPLASLVQLWKSDDLSRRCVRPWFGRTYIIF